MDDSEHLRETLRRQAYDLKVGLTELAYKLRAVDDHAASSAQKGREGAFEAWSYLATPFEEEEDH